MKINLRNMTINYQNLKKHEKNNKELQQNEKLFEEQYEPKIKEYCQNYKIGIIQKYQDIVNLLIYQNKEDIINFKKYLKRKKNRCKYTRKF